MTLAERGPARHDAQPPCALSAGRRVAIGAVAAAAADMLVFVPMIDAIVGALWVRILAATTVALVVSASSSIVVRAVSWSWHLRAVLVIGLALAESLAALVLGNKLRANHLDCLKHGLPPGPAFLLWVDLSTSAAAGVVVSGAQFRRAMAANRLAAAASALQEDVRRRVEALSATVDLRGRLATAAGRVGPRARTCSRYGTRAGSRGHVKHAAHVRASVGSGRLTRLLAGAFA